MKQNNYSAITVIDSIMNLTSHTEKKGLEKSLLLAVNALIPTTNIRLFEVKKTGEKHQISLLAFSANGVISSSDSGDSAHEVSDELTTAFKSISQHHESELIANADDSGWQVIYPSFDAYNEIFLILVQSCQKSTIQERKIVHGIFKVYANHVALIDKIQRDKLTGLFNRETLDDEITKILVKGSDDLFDVNTNDARRNSGKARSWLGVIDIDHFKAINDNYGHLYGDEVLILTSRLMTSGCMRDDDLVYRYGGEEFVVLLKATTEHDAMNAFERLRKIIAEHDFPQVGNLTISIGFVEITTQQTASDVIGQADDALYYAKNNGRNQTHSYHQLTKQGLVSVSEQVGTSDVELF
jgi:two-component system cell cycle response regulator